MSYPTIITVATLFRVPVQEEIPFNNKKKSTYFQ